VLELVVNVQTSDKPLHQLSAAESKNKSQDHQMMSLGLILKQLMNQELRGFNQLSVWLGVVIKSRNCGRRLRRIGRRAAARSL
jgi:hypothetical protein